MRLIFSWFADAGAWPAHPGSGDAALDEEVVGPLRLLDHVETMLGLGRPDVADVQRIAVYRRKMEAAGPDRFWSSSFGVDSWSSARELLRWRDELIETGWTPGAGAERSRLADIGAAETSGPALPLGRSDRLRAAIRTLGDCPVLSLEVVLVDDLATLPAGWRALMTALRSSGATIAQLPLALPASAGGDIGLLASGAAGVKPAGDGSVVLLSADTEIAACEAVAAWLASAEPDGQRDVVFVLGKDTDLLDHTLARHGLPRFGATAPSPHRALLQVLPLAFSLAWDPPDPNRLLDFLLLPTSPIPRSVARKLAEVVAENPGVGGREWVEAWDKIASEVPEGADPAKHVAKVEAWKEIVAPATRRNPKAGLPRLEARAIADRVAQWAIKRAATDEDELIATLAKTAGDLSAAIDASGLAALDRVLVERMIEETLSNGVADPATVAEASPWRAVRHPGAIWGAAGTVVWWHFADVGETSASVRWNETEREALASAGCPLDDPELGLRLLAAAWERPLRHAGERLILVRPSVAAGAEAKAHPLWHTLVARAPKIEAAISFSAEALFRNDAVDFAERSLPRSATPISTTPTTRRTWTAASDAVRPRPSESASSLETLLTCPLRWTLRYACHLRPGLRQSLPEAEKLLGLIAHRIAEDCFLPGPAPTPADVESFARRRLPELVPEMAATLLMPECAAELSAAKTDIPSALADLARFLRDEDLTIVEVEKSFAAADTLAPGFGFNGRIDMRATTETGRQVVIDLKWYRTDHYVRRDLRLGKSIQLGVYGRHVSGPTVDARVGYFMLRQGKFLTTDPGGAGVSIDGPQAKASWDRVVASFGDLTVDMAKGNVRSAVEHRGLKDPEKFADPYLLAPPRCSHCDFGAICGEE